MRGTHLLGRSALAVLVTVAMTVSACSDDTSDDAVPTITLVPASDQRPTTTGPAATTATTAAPCDRPAAPGSTTATIQSGGRERSYLQYVPPTYDGSTPVPLVVDLRAGPATAEDVPATNRFETLADEETFVVVAPRVVGEPPTWNVPGDPAGDQPGVAGAPDDTAFLADLLDQATATLCIDPRRVFVAGFSDGARMASWIGCALADRIAAVAAVSGLQRANDCDPDRAVPVIAFHGTDDDLIPYDGGGPASSGNGVEEAAQRWADANGCISQPGEVLVSDAVTSRTWVGCDDAADVILYTIAGGGHGWPDGPLADDGGDGLDATALIWDFFTGHARQQPD